MAQVSSFVLVTGLLQTVPVSGALTTTSTWLDPSVLAALMAGALSAGVGLLLFVAYLKTNRLQKELIKVTRRQQEWLEETKDPKLLIRSATLERFSSSRSFVIQLEFLNPGEIPIQIEKTISNLDQGELKTEDYTRKQREYRTAEPRKPFKTDLTIMDDRAEYPTYWPSTAAVTLKYVAARTKLVAFQFEVHASPSRTEAFLMLTKIEESRSLASSG